MYREEIEQYIESHKAEMLEDICTLCRINSEKMPYQEGMPYGKGPAEALSCALTMAEKYGFAINNYDNYVGTADLNDKEAQLDILAHLDIVPAGDGWTVTEAFEPVVKDGKLYGRGTSDDKGPAVAALYAMRAVKELGIPVTKNVRLILGTDEECGSSDIEHYYKIEKEAPMTFSPDSSFPVTNIEKGSLTGRFEADFKESAALPRLKSFTAGTKVNVVPGKAEAVIEGLSLEELEAAAGAMEGCEGIRYEFAAEDGSVTVRAIGESSHASKPWKGKNALTGLLSFVAKLPLADCEQMKLVKSLNTLMPHGDIYGEGLGIAMADELSGPLTLAIDILSITESRIEGCFDSRCPLCADDDNVLKPAKAAMRAHGITLLSEALDPPHHVSGDSEFVRTLNRCYEEWTGKEGGCVAIGGGTYVHHLKNGVAFGAAMPETENRMHGPDEFAVVDELLASAKIFAQVIAELCR